MRNKGSLTADGPTKYRDSRRVTNRAPALG